MAEKWSVYHTNCQVKIGFGILDRSTFTAATCRLVLRVFKNLGSSKYVTAEIDLPPPLWDEGLGPLDNISNTFSCPLSFDQHVPRPMLGCAIT